MRPTSGIDKVLIYRFDADRGTLAASDPPFAAVRPAAGPRHFAFHPSGRFAYVINELNVTLTAFAVDANRGSLTEVETVSTLPPGETVKEGFSTADVQVHPSGRFLFGSNRGHDSIVVFAIDDKTGRLTYVENEPTQGSTPRGFGIDPSGRYLLAANQRSDSVVVFRIDQTVGTIGAGGSHDSRGVARLREVRRSLNAASLQPERAEGLWHMEGGLSSGPPRVVRARGLGAADTVQPNAQLLALGR